MPDPHLKRLAELLNEVPDCVRSRPQKLHNLLQAFVGANENASQSPNFQSQVLHMQLPSAVHGEAANVVLNVCYERENVNLVLEAGGAPPLLQLLTQDDVELQANAAGAIQSICFQKEGRHLLREQGAIPVVLPLLTSPSMKVRIRAVGAIHNISSEAEAIRVIRRLHGIAPLIALLRVPNATICASAAGALQNLSREPAARKEAHTLGAVVPLADLLFGEDVQAQTCAAGAILNILGPKLGSEEPNHPKRVAFKKLLSMAITVGMLHGSISKVPSAADASDAIKAASRSAAPQS